MISFLDLKNINEKYNDAFLDKTKDLLDSGWYILGNEVALFEKNYAQYCNANYCVGVGNGLDALVLILKAHIQLHNLKKGDEIIVPANTYIASILAILHADLKPIFVEPNINTYLIDYNLIQEKISPKTKAIMVVHLYGRLTDMVKISEIALRNNLFIIEDAAQSHGTKSNISQSQQNTCLDWTAAAHSFYPSKNLGALGDAGAITTNNKKLADTLKLMRNYGSGEKYHNEIIGFNSRLDEIQASFLNIKLPFLDAENDLRRQIAKQYLTEIHNPKIKLPVCDHIEDHVFHLFVILTKNRKDFMTFMKSNGIETMIHYPIASHKQVALDQYANLNLPVTEKIHDQCVSLPLNPILSTLEISKIIKTINDY